MYIWVYIKCMSAMRIKTMTKALASSGDAGGAGGGPGVVQAEDGVSPIAELKGH